MKLGLTVAGFGPHIKIDIERIREAEALGYDSVWTAEAWGNDAITPLAGIAAQTTTIKLGTGIMQMSARTPAMCAMQAATVDELSGGRMIVGLGPSGPQVIEGWHGMPYGKPLTRTREYISILRRIFAREAPLEHEGECYQIPFRGEGSSGLGKPLRSILHPRADIPIVTATISPKGVECAAECADGFIPIWTSPEGLATFDDAIARGFAKSDDEARKQRFEITPMVNVHIGEDLQACRDRMKPGIALYVGGMGARTKNFYNQLVARMGWEDAAREIQDLYLDGKKKAATAAVPDDLVDAITLVGPKERVAERVAAWKESAAAGLILSGPRAEDLRTMAELCL
jgi:F420-dependent oxidoreductase-like protein